jgi:hypothetical protein
VNGTSEVDFQFKVRLGRWIKNSFLFLILVFSITAAHCKG